VFDAAEMAARARDMPAVPKAFNSEIQALAALAGAGEVAAEYAASAAVASPESWRRGSPPYITLN
jgi:hypothetical protein